MYGFCLLENEFSRTKWTFILTLVLSYNLQVHIFELEDRNLDFYLHDAGVATCASYPVVA